MTTPSDQTIEIDGLNLRYRCAGQGEPLVLVHGLGGILENWDPVLAPLAERRQVYALDLPGHGLSDKPERYDYRLPNLAKVVMLFTRMLGLETFDLMGHSMGGAIALQLAEDYPGLARRLVLVAPAGLGREIFLGMRLMTLPFLGERLAQPNRAKARETAALFVHDPSVYSEALMDYEYQLQMLPGRQAALLRATRTFASLFGQRSSVTRPLLRRLGQVQVPTLIVWGRQDQIVPAAHAEVARQGIPNAQAWLIDRCGHNPMLEHPAAFSQRVLAFLNS